jgi:tight adherence protein C
MLVAGVLLALGGLHWVNRLVPVPPGSDASVAVVAEVLASVVAAGVGLRMVIDLLAPKVPAELTDAFCRARRKVILGSTWSEALARSGHDDVRRLAEVLQNAQTLGTPVADGLRRLAGDLRTARALAFDQQIRRAPVLMVLPLVLCVLPSFLLLALGPFIRGLALA